MPDRPPRAPSNVLYERRDDLPIPEDMADARRVWPFHELTAPRQGFVVVRREDERRALRAARKWEQRKPGVKLVSYRNAENKLVIVRKS